MTIIIAIILVAPFSFALGLLFSDILPTRTPSRFYKKHTRLQCIQAALGRKGKAIGIFLNTVGEAQHKAILVMNKVDVAADTAIVRDTKAAIARLSAATKARSDARREQMAYALQQIAADEYAVADAFRARMATRIIRKGWAELFLGRKLQAGITAFATA